jgi:hypothetical protein
VAAVRGGVTVAGVVDREGGHAAQAEREDRGDDPAGERGVHGAEHEQSMLQQPRVNRQSVRVLTVALAALGTLACGASGRSDETAVTLRARHAAGRAVSGAADRTFATLAGDRVTLTRALVTVSSVELFPCPSAARRIWRELSPVGTAWAHGTGTDRRLAAPNLVDVLAPDAEVAVLGQLHPYAGSYCWAHVVLSPADADTPGATAAGMVGASLVLEGTLSAADGTNPRPFALRSVATLGADVTAPAFPRIDLGKNDQAQRTLVLTYGGWLDGVDPLAGGAADQVLGLAVAAIAAE